MTRALEWAGLRTLTGNPISDQAHRLLVHMSHTAMDKGDQKRQARRYYARWETCAYALGYEIPDQATSAAQERAREAAYRKVKRARRELVNAGVLRRIDQTGYAGRTAEYELFPAVDKSDEGGHHSPPVGDTTVPQNRLKGDTSVREGGHHSPPKETTQETTYIGNNYRRAQE